MINTQNKFLISLAIDLTEVLTAVESGVCSSHQVERFCFLFRRSKSQTIYSNYLRGMIQSKEKIATLRPIFNKILENFRVAKNEMYACLQAAKLSTRNRRSPQ